MTIANLEEVLMPAMEEHRAVAGLVVLGWEDANAYVKAADETGIPIILQAGPGCRAHTPIPILGKMFRYLADQTEVPIVCHIDHGSSAEECLEGIDSGFTSVMFDGSSLPISENIKTTEHIVKKADAAGVSVEGEVGFVGYSEGSSSEFTLPEEAARFNNETGATALAISIGNIHLKADKNIKIDFSALNQIEKVTTLPLVLHGGSGISVNIRKYLARESRVSKFNIGTELRMAFGNSLRKSVTENPNTFDRIKLLSPTVDAVKNKTIEVIKELNGKPE